MCRHGDRLFCRQPSVIACRRQYFENESTPSSLIQGPQPRTRNKNSVTRITAPLKTIFSSKYTRPRRTCLACAIFVFYYYYLTFHSPFFRITFATLHKCTYHGDDVVAVCLHIHLRLHVSSVCCWWLRRRCRQTTQKRGDRKWRLK